MQTAVDFMAGDENTDNHRLDKWLWHARFYKTRSLATAAINGGKVHLNAERVKPAHRVRIGDRLSLSLGGLVAEFEVLGLPSRRGPAAEAQAQYLETPASAERRARLREQQRLAQVSRPRPDVRPDKRDRRRLMRLQRDQT
jgi:ribosome-associated heat shock protein Hsp15